MTSHGIWILARGKGLFISHEDFPWLKEVSIGNVFNVEEPTPGHFSWSEIDVDLDTESIEHPMTYIPHLFINHLTIYYRQLW